MSVHKGTIHKISNGQWKAGWSQHEFIDIGEGRIDDVMIQDFLTNFLEAGVEAEISVHRVLGKKNNVVAIKRDGKVEMARIDKYRSQYLVHYLGVLVVNVFLSIGAGFLTAWLLVEYAEEAIDAAFPNGELAAVVFLLFWPLLGLLITFRKGRKEYAAFLRSRSALS